MKKFILALLILSFCLIPLTVKANNDLVCGESYMYIYQDVMYLLKFKSSNPNLPCSSGIATLYWLNQKSSYAFTVYNTHFIDVEGVGKFVLDTYAEPDTLYYLRTTSVIFTLY